MHIQFSQALSDGMNTPGQRIMRAIVAGECDLQPLATLGNSRGKQDADESARACASLRLVTNGVSLCQTKQ